MLVPAFLQRDTINEGFFLRYDRPDDGRCNTGNRVPFRCDSEDQLIVPATIEGELAGLDCRNTLRERELFWTSGVSMARGYRGAWGWPLC